jgi:hypothetical protein
MRPFISNICPRTDGENILYLISPPVIWLASRSWVQAGITNDPSSTCLAIRSHLHDFHDHSLHYKLSKWFLRLCYVAVASAKVMCIRVRWGNVMHSQAVVYWSAVRLRDRGNPPRQQGKYPAAWPNVEYKRRALSPCGSSPCILPCYRLLCKSSVSRVLTCLSERQCIANRDVWLQPRMTTSCFGEEKFSYEPVKT